MKLMEAIEEVLGEDSRTRDNKYLWLYMIKTARKLGFRMSIDFKNKDGKKLPSPDAMLAERRIILNKKNKFPQDFKPEANTIYESPKTN